MSFFRRFGRILSHLRQFQINIFLLQLDIVCGGYQVRLWCSLTNTIIALDNIGTMKWLSDVLFTTT